MANPFKVRGDRFERDVMHMFLNKGWPAKKIAGSGSVDGYPGDVVCTPPERPRLLVQCKFFNEFRGRGVGFLDTHAPKFPYGFILNDTWLVAPFERVCQVIIGEGAVPFRYPKLERRASSIANMVESGGENMIVITARRKPVYAFLHCDYNGGKGFMSPMMSSSERSVFAGAGL